MHEVNWTEVLYIAKKRFIFLVGFVFAGFLLFWWLTDPIIANIKSHLLPSGALLTVRSPLELVMVKVELSLLFSVILALPVLAFMVMRRLSIRFNLVSLAVWLSAAALLFLFGFTFTYILLLPLTIRVLTEFATGAEILPYYSVEQFVLFVVLTALVFSLVFDLPVVISWLAIRGYVAVESLKRWRRGVYVIIFVLSAVITADPTPLTQVLLAIPLIILYEASIMSARIFGKKRISS